MYIVKATRTIIQEDDDKHKSNTRKLLGSKDNKGTNKRIEMTKKKEGLY